MMFWYGNTGFNGWGYALMTIVMIAFCALVIIAIVALVRYLGRGTGHTTTPRSSTPEQVLGERFARGEIDEEEYRRRLNALRGTQTTGR